MKNYLAQVKHYNRQFLKVIHNYKNLVSTWDTVDLKKKRDSQDYCLTRHNIAITKNQPFSKGGCKK